jgi:hypothetical protein
MSECFYLDENGKRQDRAIHEAILGDDELDPIETRRYLREMGYSDEMIRTVYGIIGQD